MNKKFLEDIKKVMIQVFNDGYEQLIMPRFEDVEENMQKMKKELKEEFKTGQQSLSNRVEIVERKMDKMDKKMDKMDKKMDKMDKKMDKIVVNDKDQEHQIKTQRVRLDEVERIVRAN